MRNLLSYQGLRELRRYRRAGTLVALDYDGTLAPITEDPAQAHMPLSTRRLLRRLARRYPTVILTGRARGDARRLLGRGSPPVIGNHGAEWPGRAAPRSAEVAAWRAALQDALAGSEGLWLEDKRHSLTIHYRQARDPAEARRRALTAAAALEGARIVGGKAVINLLPPGAHKGSALLAACRRQRCPRALFMGDDDTDEDAFALARPGRVLAVRVGLRRGSRAPWYLRRRAQVDRLLRALLAPAQQHQQRQGAKRRQRQHRR